MPIPQCISPSAKAKIALLIIWRHENIIKNSCFPIIIRFCWLLYTNRVADHHRPDVLDKLGFIACLCSLGWLVCMATVYRQTHQCRRCCTGRGTHFWRIWIHLRFTRINADNNGLQGNGVHRHCNCQYFGLINRSDWRAFLCKRPKTSLKSNQLAWNNSYTVFDFPCPRVR